MAPSCNDRLHIGHYRKGACVHRFRPRRLDRQLGTTETASFDVVIAIESSEHMANLEEFFAEAARVLKPGGRFVVCAWLSKESPPAWERRLLLEPICREGRLRGMGSAAEYGRL